MPTQRVPWQDGGSAPKMLSESELEAYETSPSSSATRTSTSPRSRRPGSPCASPEGTSSQM
eukprot:8545364-Pyramimonas_sp.AAC.1